MSMMERMATALKDFAEATYARLVRVEERIEKLEEEIERLKREPHKPFKQRLREKL